MVSKIQSLEAEALLSERRSSLKVNMNNRQLCNGGVNHIVSPREHQGAALQGQGRSIVPPAYQNLVATHLSIQSSAEPCKPGPGALCLVPVQVRLCLGSLRALGHGDSSVLGSRQGQGSARQLCGGAWQRPPSQGLP